MDFCDSLQDRLSLSSKLSILSLFLSWLAISAALPLSAINLPQTLSLNFNTSNRNLTNLINPLQDWPDDPFSIDIPTSDPNEHCHLHFATLGIMIGSGLQTRFLLLDIHQQLKIFEDKPDGSVPYAFDLSNQELRFIMESMPQHPLRKELVVAALEILYTVIASDEAIELRALVVCDGIAFGRFRIMFLNDVERGRNVSLPLSVTAIK